MINIHKLAREHHIPIHPARASPRPRRSEEYKVMQRSAAARRSPEAEALRRSRLSQALKGHIGWAHDEETRKRIGSKHKGRRLSEEHKRKIALSHIGIGHNEATKRLISSRLTGHQRTPESRRKQGLSICKRIQAGAWHPERRGTSGKFYSKKNNKILHYRSLLELAWYQALEADPQVRQFRVEPVCISYQFEGHWKHYIPDLKANMIDKTVQIIEIKPEWQHKHPKNLAKWNAATAWCKSKTTPTTFRVVGYKELPTNK